MIRKLSCIALCLILAGCGSTYLTSTKSGDTIASDEKPELDNDTKMLRIEDESGNVRQVPSNEVKQIQEF